MMISDCTLVCDYCYTGSVKTYSFSTVQPFQLVKYYSTWKGISASVYVKMETYIYILLSFVISGPNSSSPTNSRSELSFHSTPAAAFDILSEQEALYVYLLFGLRDKKLGKTLLIWAANCSSDWSICDWIWHPSYLALIKCSKAHETLLWKYATGLAGCCIKQILM